MTVSELIERLRDCDPDALVLSQSGICQDLTPVGWFVWTESDAKRDSYASYYPETGPSERIKPGMVIL